MARTHHISRVESCHDASPRITHHSIIRGKLDKLFSKTRHMMVTLEGKVYAVIPLMRSARANQVVTILAGLHRLPVFRVSRTVFNNRGVSSGCVTVPKVAMKGRINAVS